jgi:hypothetical protein
MRDLNKAQLIGHLAHAPDMRYLDNATARPRQAIDTTRRGIRS